MKSTTYLTNDLGDVKVKKFETDKEKNKIHQNVDDLIPTFDSINKSFDDVELRTKNSIERSRNSLNKSNNNKDNQHQIEWISPILPNSYLWLKELTLLHFDENPEEVSLFDGTSIQTSQNSTSNRVLDSIITNIRPMDNDSANGRTGDWLAMSLIAPTTHGIHEDKDEVEFNWMRDYRTRIKGSSGNMDNTFLLQINSSDHNVSFCPLPTRLEMKRMKIEESDGHLSKVRRLGEDLK